MNVIAGRMVKASPLSGVGLKRDKFTMPIDLVNELIIDCANFVAAILHRGHSINKQFTKAYRRSK